MNGTVTVWIFRRSRLLCFFAQWLADQVCQGTGRRRRGRKLLHPVCHDDVHAAGDRPDAVFEAVSVGDLGKACWAARHEGVCS